MTVFILIAAAVSVGVAWLLLRPLLRTRADGRPADKRTALFFAVLLFASGGGLYAWLSQYSWQEADAGNSPAATAARLAKDLARHPDDPQGWMRLGELYFDLEQYPLALRAFQRVDRLANGQDPAALSALAETMLAQDFENIRGPAGRLFERVLEMQPGNPKALLYSALAAMGRGDHTLAKDRFERVLAQNPPPQIRDIIEKQLQSLGTAESGVTTPAATNDGAAVKVRVDVSPALRYQLTANSALFVAARDPAQPGPPFAAKRLPLQFPVEVTLTAADAMMPQRRIQAGQVLDVVARISLSGQPQSATGDPFGQVNYRVGQDGQLTLLIDKLAP